MAISKFKCANAIGLHTARWRFSKSASTVLRTQKGMRVHSAPIHGDWHGVHAAACLGAPTIGDVTPMRRPSLLMRMRPLRLLPLQRHQPRCCRRCHSRC